MRLQPLLVVLLLGAPASALAQPDFDEVDRYDSSISGEAVLSVGVFYDQLSPYGVWVNEPRFGRVFIPDRAQFVPYTVGHWAYTNIGFVWISAEPFEWATSHYGRWLYSDAYGRWVWRPDTVWGPSWVEWRQYGDYYGWAPLVPEFAIDIGYIAPFHGWHYCGAAHIFDLNVSRYYEPPRHAIEIHRGARPLDHYARIGGVRANVGPSARMLRDRHVDVRPTRLGIQATGRWTPDESRAATQRAEQRRPIFEDTNRRRIENNTQIRRAQTRIEQQPRPQIQQPRPEVQRPRIQQPRPQIQRPEVQRPRVQQPQIQRPQVQQPRPQIQRPQVQQPRPQIQQPRPQVQRPQAQQPRPQVQQSSERKPRK